MLSHEVYSHLLQRQQEGNTDQSTIVIALDTVFLQPCSCTMLMLSDLDIWQIKLNVAHWYSPANAGDASSTPGLGRFSGKGNGNALQYSCLKNPMDIGPWWATVHGVAVSQTWLSEHEHMQSWIMNKVITENINIYQFLKMQYLVLVHTGCYNKIPHTSWLINSRSVFLIVLETGKLPSGEGPLSGSQLALSHCVFM